MYQTIVLGLGFLLLFGAAYLIKNTDRTGILTSNIVQTSTATSTGTSTPARKLEGNYLCDSDSGCSNPSLLLINEAGEVSMNTSYDNGVEVLQESGTWKNEKDGGVTILLTGTDAGIYPVPHTLYVKYVSPFSLSGIVFDSTAYKDWIKPVFRKQEKQEE